MTFELPTMGGEMTFKLSTMGGENFEFYLSQTEK